MQKTPSIASNVSNTSTKGCLGCRSFFKDGQQLQLQDIRVEFKNYNEIPLKDSKHKYTLLKTINAFLNTKGGSIFIGVQDSDCRVKGYYLSYKQQDEFKFFVKTLVEKMYPPIDFSNREEVNTCFLPVMNSEKFTGKYIIKIIVRQGQRDSVYTFAERIRLMGADKSDYEEFQIRNAYRRVGPGGIEKLDPLTLLQEVYRKAKTPNQEEKIHEGCHPQPLEPSYVFKNVGFSGLGHRTLREKLISKIDARLEKHPMECEVNYDQETKMLLIQFEKEEDAEKIKNLLHDNLELLRSEDIELEYIGPETGTYIFRNKKKQQYHEPAKDYKPKEVHKQQIPEKNKSPPTVQYSKKISKTFQNGCFYVLTHIDVKNRDRLTKFVNGLFSKRNYKYEILTNSILIHCQNQSEMDHIQQMFSKNEKELHCFGHNNKIVYGQMTGHLCIYNYFEKQRKELFNYINNYLLKGRVKACEFKKDNMDRSRSFMDLKLDARDAVEALDILLEDEDIRNFKMRGSHDVPKMKFMLKCNNF